MEYEIQSTELESMAAYVGVAGSTTGLSDEAAAAIRLRWFDLISADLQAHAEQNGATYQDSLSITAIIRQTHLQSAADTLETFLEEARVVIERQCLTNETFVAMWAKKQRLVLSYVRRAVGNNDHDVDVEQLVIDTFTAALRKMGTGGYEYRSDQEENAWLKMTARGVVSNLRKKHARHRDKIVKGLAADKDCLSDGMPNSWAITPEDRIAIGEVDPAEEGADDE